MRPQTLNSRPVNRAWTAVLALSTVAVGAVSLAALPVSPPVRTAVVLWFVLVCPGMAVVRTLRLGDETARWMLGVALSVSLATIISSALLYAGGWSWKHTLVILMAIAAIGIGVDVARGILTGEDGRL